MVSPSTRIKDVYKRQRLTLTGNLGDVMKESAMLALEYIKAHASILNLDEEIFDNWRCV